MQILFLESLFLSFDLKDNFFVDLLYYGYKNLEYAQNQCKS